MRAFDMALAALALRASPTRPPRRQRRLLPAVDDANPAWNDRNALDHPRAALVASLWPEARPCVVPALYLQLPAPALFGALFRVDWRQPLPREAQTAPPNAETAFQLARAA